MFFNNEQLKFHIKIFVNCITFNDVNFNFIQTYHEFIVRFTDNKVNYEFYQFDDRCYQQYRVYQ